MEQCPLAGKAVRIPLAEDRRVFTPVARSSYVWQDYYDERSAVERVNSRLAGGFGFERPGIRGRRRCSCASPWTIMRRWPWGGSGPANPSTCRSNPPPERRLRAGHQTKSSRLRSAPGLS